MGQRLRLLLSNKNTILSGVDYRMEQINLDPHNGCFSIDEIRRLNWGMDNVYSLAVSLRDGDWFFNVGAAPDDNDDRPYVTINNEDLKVSVIVEALPILIREMERQTQKPKSQEEFSFYIEAVKELEKKYYEFVLGK